MSQENVEFARSVFDRWNRGERRFRDEEIHPDVVVTSPILGKTVHGRTGVRQYLRPPPAGQQSTASPGLITAAVLFALLFPLIGLILGIVVMSKNAVGQGVSVILLSIVAFFAWASIIFLQGS
jgi:hypothetical protein